MEERPGWKYLAGRQVKVLVEGRTLRTGYVKDVTVAADPLWLEADGVEPRALYEKAQGHAVLPVSEPVSDKT